MKPLDRDDPRHKRRIVALNGSTFELLIVGAAAVIAVVAWLIMKLVGRERARTVLVKAAAVTAALLGSRAPAASRSRYPRPTTSGFGGHLRPRGPWPL